MTETRSRSNSGKARLREEDTASSPTLPNSRSDEGSLGAEVLRVLCHFVVSRWADRHGLEIDAAELADLTHGFDKGDTERLERAIESVAGAGVQKAAKPPPKSAPVGAVGSESMSDTARGILEAAADCFLYRGDSVSLDEIAKVAGVTKPTIYSYFKGKKELFRAAMLLVAAEMVPRIEMPSVTGNLREELLRYARASRAVLLLERNLLAFRATLLHMREIPDLGQQMGRQSVMRINTSLAAFFKQAMDFGSIRPVDPELLSEFFFAATAGQERTKRLSGFEPSSPEREEQYIQQFVDVLLHGIAADPTQIEPAAAPGGGSKKRKTKIKR